MVKAFSRRRMVVQITICASFLCTCIFGPSQRLRLMELENVEVTLTKRDVSDTQEDLIYDFDTVLEYIGNMGKYQALLAAFVLYLTLPVGMHEVGAVFLLAVPDYRCFIPGIDDSRPTGFANCSGQRILELTTPSGDEGYDGCKMYEYNYTESFCHENRTGIDMVVNRSSIPCESYVYSNDVYGWTVVTEWDLVCDRLILGSTSSAVFFAGGLIGSLAGGTLCDNFGRRTAMMVSNVMLLGSGISCAFSPSLVFFTAMRFVIAFTMSITFAGGFVYATEILGGKWRMFVGTFYNAGYAIGYTILSAIAYKWKNWRDMQLAMSLTSAPFILLWILMPQSPRWLFAKRRNAKGKAASNLIASRNGKAIPDDAWSMALRKNSVSNMKYYSLLTLFRKPGIRMVTIIIVICWFIVSLTYFGLSLNIGSFSGDVYINNALSGVAEIIAAPFAMVIMKKLGRRISASASFVCAGLMCIVSSVINYCLPDLGILGTCLALFGKLAISMAYTIMYVYTSELYPTVVRAIAITVGTASAVVASVITPYTLYLQYQVSWLPGIIFGVTSLLAGLASLRLKETRDHKLMTTLAEAETFYHSAASSLASVGPLIVS